MGSFGCFDAAIGSPGRGMEGATNPLVERHPRCCRLLLSSCGSIEEVANEYAYEVCFG